MPAHADLTPDKGHRMVSLTVLTGLRVGELLALRWRATDLTTGTLCIRESVFQCTFQIPKSQKSIRTIPIGSLACELLRNHRQRLTHVAPEDLVFPNRTAVSTTRLSGSKQKICCWITTIEVKKIPKGKEVRICEDLPRPGSVPPTTASQCAKYAANYPKAVRNKQDYGGKWG